MSSAQMGTFGLVIFDLDGVLVDSSPAHAAAYEDLYRALGVAGRPYTEIAGRATRSVVEELVRGRTIGTGSVERWIRLKQEAARRYLDRPGLVFPDVGPALDALEARGVSVAIGTSASRATTNAVVRVAGWDGRFPTIVTADDVHAGKPDPEIYLEVIARTGADPGRTLIVEDSEAGLRSAMAAGAWVASVRTGEVAHGVRFLGSFPGLEPVVELATVGAAWLTSS